MTIEMDSIPERSVNELVGERVHQALWRRKITQTQFGPKLGITQSALSKKMRGERAFGVDELLEISAFLDIPITDLLPTRKDPHPDGPDGGSTSRLRESNSRPFHYE
ncbi:helix-turn-helix domain-containing protein [Rhodococcoides fascians]|uniref:helix-turn-helix domain-containing protein n=1 Tax=Rhodococcoides fascians TaxID=1828 RepID=UPI00389B0F84